MKKTLLLAALFVTGRLLANDPTDSLQQLQAQLRILDSINSKLHYKTGKVPLAGNKVALQVPSNYRFLDSADARYVLEEVWGNPAGQTALGMLVPANMMAPIADYAFVVEYQDMGYVKDGDATEIDYDDLLAEMKKDAFESNKERAAQGLETMDLIGWASAPYYDKSRNVLHWAKQFSVPGSETNTLNYDVRVLGRHGVLMLQAVSSIDLLDSVKRNIDPLLSAVSFTAGNRYSDFNESTDGVAAWTIGGLVAGKVLAKAGFFAFIMKFLKVIIAGAIALGGAVFKYFKNRKKDEDLQPAFEAEQGGEA